MSTIYTIGYAGWSPEQLRTTVSELGAELWDIRYSPWSKSPQWQGHALRRLLGPAYVHMAALGNQNYKGGEILLVAPDRAVEPARRVMARRPLVLLCGCKDWASCHRTVAALYLAEMIGVRIEHLTPPAKAAPAPVESEHVRRLLAEGEALPGSL